VRIWIIALVLALVGGVAHAQANDQRRPIDIKVVDPKAAPPAAQAPAADAPPADAPPPAPEDRDRTHGSGKGMAALFWLFALGTVGGSIFVITRRNLIAAVMGMVATFFGVAAIYMMLYADFLAVIQMLVYAGAIMVLFVFVVMILNKPEDEPWGMVGLPGKALAGLAMLYLTFRLGSTLWGVEVRDDAMDRPDPVQIIVRTEKITAPDGAVLAARKPILEDRDWGSTASVGKNLFSEYLFPFEAVSILLLIAVVGAIAVARPLKDDEPEPEETPT
jgi:NADH-quinone oxidoreductase subunit J